MRYLFFDLEYASSSGGTSKICEFGYTLTDESFNVVEKSNFIIDPNIYSYEWDYRVLNKILTRRKITYESSPKFDQYYDDIVELITGSDYVFGHTLDSDAKALNDDCQRYELPSIDFTFYDIKIIFKALYNLKKEPSVSSILESFNIEGDTRTHDAEADSYNTMLDLKAMVDAMKISVEDLIALCPEAKNQNKDYIVESIEINKMIRDEKFEKTLSGEDSNFMKGRNKNEMLFIQFLDNVQPEPGYEKKLNNMSFSISINYEECHFRQMLNIVQMLANYGATYRKKATEADVFVKYDILLKDGKFKSCSKLKHVNEAINEGKQIKIISFDEFMSIFGITEKELDEMPMISFDWLYRDDAIIKDRKTKKIVQSRKNDKPKEKQPSQKSTLGELFPNFFNEDEEE